MQALLILVGLFVLYEVMRGGGLSGLLGGGTGTASGSAGAHPAPVINQAGTTVASPTFTFEPASSIGPGIGTTLIGTSIGIGTSGAVVGALAPSLVGTTLGTAIPILGSVAGAIFGALMAASAKRAAQARSENQAVANEVPAWDAGIKQIVTAFNAGQITADEAAQLLASPQTRMQNLNNYPNGPLWQAYWNVVCPQIQPGRNGCQCGTAPHQPPVTHCSGNNGAACCVGYDDLDNGHLYVLQAILRADSQPGTPVTSNTIPTVYASKYGGIDRPGYTITVTRTAAVSSNVFQL